MRCDGAVTLIQMIELSLRIKKLLLFAANIKKPTRNYVVPEGQEMIAYT